jgi:hypothetical protein
MSSEDRSGDAPAEKSMKTASSESSPAGEFLVRKFDEAVGDRPNEATACRHDPGMECAACRPRSSDDQPEPGEEKIVAFLDQWEPGTRRDVADMRRDLESLRDEAFFAGLNHAESPQRKAVVKMAEEMDRSSEARATDEDRAVRHLAVYPSGPGARKALAALLTEIRNEERQHAVAWLRRFADERHPIEAGEFLLSPSGRGLLMQAAGGIERGEHQ